jgi:hypothetical protein
MGRLFSTLYCTDPFGESCYCMTVQCSSTDGLFYFMPSIDIIHNIYEFENVLTLSNMLNDSYKNVWIMSKQSVITS